MNDMAAHDVDCTWRVVKRWRGRVFVYHTAHKAQEESNGK